MNYLRKLRVGIDGRAFTSPAAGVRRYVSELVPALLSIGAPLDVVVLGGSGASLPAGVPHVSEPWHPPTNLVWAAVGLPRAARRAAVDLIHAPAYTAPLYSAVPVVLTIHDVSYERHPEWYPYRRDWLRRAFYRRSARAASHILTDSEFSRGEIAAAYAIDRDRITVAPLGASADFDEGSTSASLPAGVVAPFLLHVGDLHERRNLSVVVKGLMEARHRLETPAPALVLAGVDRGTGDRLAAEAGERGAPDAIVRLGAVSESTLRALYHGAAALVYPSRYEGFGLPLVEAMASGTPVVAADTSSIPEVVGPAGVLFPAGDHHALARAVGELLDRPEGRRALVERGLARAREFDWKATARKHADVYRGVLASRGAAESD